MLNRKKSDNRQTWPLSINCFCFLLFSCTCEKHIKKSPLNNSTDQIASRRMKCQRHKCAAQLYRPFQLLGTLNVGDARGLLHGFWAKFYNSISKSWVNISCFFKAPVVDPTVQWGILWLINIFKITVLNQQCNWTFLPYYLVNCVWGDDEVWISNIVYIFFLWYWKVFNWKSKY